VAYTASLQRKPLWTCSAKAWRFTSSAPARFFIKVRQEMRRLSLPIEKRDAQHHSANRDELLQGSGASKVPCLKITDSQGQTQWLQDSAAIVTYLRAQFGRKGSGSGSVSAPA